MKLKLLAEQVRCEISAPLWYSQGDDAIYREFHVRDIDHVAVIKSIVSRACAAHGVNCHFSELPDGLRVTLSRQFKKDRTTRYDAVIQKCMEEIDRHLVGIQ